MKKLMLLICMISIYQLANALDYARLWQISVEKDLHVAGEQKLTPDNYILAKFNTVEFQLLQATIPVEQSGLTEIISLPDPQGNEMKFRIFECPMMEKELADKYPQIKTYSAISVDNPAVTAKLDFTVFGFHAKIFNGSETYFIDPYTDLNTDWYMIYYKKDYKKPLSYRMACHTEDAPEQLAKEQAVSLSANELPQISYKQNGTNKRTYRLALACTQEYAAAVGGAVPTKASVLSAMVTSMNRVNGVFEKDFSMHANLVANNDTLIYLANDPYTNNNGGTMLGQNQTAVTQRIGSANYDFGHVFSTGGGGIASLGCVCNNSLKAQGVTGSPNPVGDPYDIDYVAHEMGHQFGGNHTFNSVTGSCSGNRSSSSAYEPGSATTIMGYAGICGSDDIMLHSDDYYHTRSLESMTGNGVMACATNVASNNGLPLLSPIAATYIIPYRTSFELTAAGTDPDNDVLTYCWEEYDRGGSGNAWDDVTTVAPILRSFIPSTSPTRVFPELSYLLQNIESYKGERLPDNARIVRFRCALRDIHNGYGAFYTSTDTLKLDVRTTTGLFRVTSHDVVGQQLNGYSQTTVTWDVAGTSAAPFTATNVDIYLSIDSGKTWAYQLATATPNNGSKVVTLPNVDATWARLKVKGSGNVFFDLNDKWIAIKKVNVPAGVGEVDDAELLLYPNPNKGLFSITLPARTSFAELEVVSNLGQTVYAASLRTKADIRLPDVTPGIYFAKIKIDGRTMVKKIVVE
ncbi:MAG: T9SS type A sorting domain-containing protein [Chitinophagaceae bacterium]|nr:T9SS type A sorting domain-containing protein [Chitinophagaceae bacterium]